VHFINIEPNHANFRPIYLKYFKGAAFMNEDLLKVYNVRSVPGKRDFYPHHHNELEIAYFRSGRGIYSITGYEYPIESGDIFIFSNNEIHKITYVDPDIVTEALNIHFLPRLLLGASEDGEPDLSRIFLNRRAGFTNRINREIAGSAYNEICSALLEIEQEMNEKKLGYTLLARQNLIRALVLILRSCNIIAANSDQKARANVAGIAAALKYIDENFQSDLTLCELCNVVRMSRSNFERLFGKYVGVSVGEYIKRRRIDCALSLLRTTNMTVLDIALASGYHNTANFNKQFKAVTGKTPREYREVQKNPD
jgi:AraC-like DNA-binding protein